MLSLNTLRTKFGVVLLVFIGVALLAFIISSKDDFGFSNTDPEVGEIDGKEVNYSEFNAAYADVKTLMGGENAGYDQSAQIISEAWQMLVTERVHVPGYQKLGLVVTDAEHAAMLKGDIASAVYGSLFTDPATGEYSVEAKNAFVEQAKANPEMLRAWQLIKKQAVIERTTSKYIDLIVGGTYANTLTLNKGVAATNNTYKGRFVVCNYTSIADSLVTVSDSEIKAYYKANQAKYKQTPYRTVNYVTFEANPTDADKKAVEETAKAAGALFAIADLNSYVRNESHASLSGAYVNASSLSEEEAAALRAGKMYGPALNGGEWYASRVAESCNAPETLELQHIALSYSDAKLADSLYKVVLKSSADFDLLALQHSIAGSRENGGVIGEVKFSDLAVELADALKSARNNQIVKVEFGGAIQIFKVLSTGSVSRHYRLATLTYPVVASQETLRAVHKEASDFAVQANGSIEKFNEAVKAKSLMSSSMNVQRGQRNVPGLANSIEVVRWANEAKVGDVSELVKIDSDYVVAVLTAVDNEEYKALDQVSEQIKRALIREKKAEMLKAKMQGATLEEIAQNADAKVEEFAEAKSSAYHVQGLGFEPRVLGALAAVSAENKGTLLPLVDGGRGVYAIVVDEVATSEEQTLEAERVKAQAEAEDSTRRSAWNAISNAVEVVDNSVNFF